MADEALFPIVDGKYTMEAEPIVRIGVVLAEDDRAALRLTLPEGRYSLATALDTSAAISIASDGGRSVSVCAEDGEIFWDACEGKNGQMSTLAIRPLGEQTGDHPGIKVHGVIAGRSFHWRKEIDVTLTGALRFVPRGGRLVMTNELPLEDYLLGVITGEMSGTCPPDFMKAQGTAARSWLLAQPRSPHPDEDFHWCNDDCCQRYQGTGGWTPQARAALAECRGEVLMTPSDHYCDARYSKNTGGISEDAESVWGEAMECLTAVVDAPGGDAISRFFPITADNVEEYLGGEWIGATGAFASPSVLKPDEVMQYLGRVDEAGDYFRWEWRLEQGEMIEALRERAGIADIAEVVELRPGSRGRSGRLERLVVVYRDASGAEKTHEIRREYHIRAGLSMRFLYSSAFIVDHERDADGRLVAANLTGGGWGHGAGLCQMGALGRALKGQGHEEILAAYFPGSRLASIYA